MKPMEVKTTQLRPRRMGAVYEGAADTYPTHAQGYLEMIQNALDKNAKNIEIFINEKIRIAYINDDGDGATRTEFNEALASIYNTTKSKDKFGRFGRGLIVFLTKCNEFTFHSRGKSGTAHKWTFHCKEILQSQDFPDIPFETMGQPRDKVWWRTQVMIKGLHLDDAVKSRIDVHELKAMALSNFGTKMRQLEATVKITHMDKSGTKTEETFTAKSYSGKPLPVWQSATDTPAGKVVVRFYKGEDSSPIPVTIGQIGDPFRLEWKTFYQSVVAFSTKNKQVSFEGKGKDLNALLRSGVVTGEIECENITIHPERNRFQRSEAFDYFVIILEQWFEEVGKKLHIEAEIATKSTLYQKIAIDAIQRIEKHPLVGQFLQVIKFGTVGKGHADDSTVKSYGTITATDAVKGQDKGKGTQVPQGTVMTVNPPGEKVTRPGHVPMLVAGDDGKERKLVRKDSKGLIIDIVPFPGLVGSEAPLFNVEPDMGRILINQLAPDFNASADRGEKVLRRFIDMVVMAALQSSISTDSNRSKAELELYVKYTTKMFLAGDQRTV